MSCKWFRGRVYFLVVMNIFRTLSEDKRMLFNVTYKDGNYKLVDKLGIHLAEDDGTWSAALPLCHSAQLGSTWDLRHRHYSE